LKWKLSVVCSFFTLKQRVSDIESCAYRLQFATVRYIRQQRRVWDKAPDHREFGGGPQTLRQFLVKKNAFQGYLGLNFCLKQDFNLLQCVDTPFPRSALTGPC